MLIISAVMLAGYSTKI